MGVELGDRQSELSEAYFSILTAVQFSTANGAPQTIAITSSQAREGKSTSALALARGLATLGARVLLVDADLRNPSLHRYGFQSCAVLGSPTPNDEIVRRRDGGKNCRESVQHHFISLERQQIGNSA